MSERKISNTLYTHLHGEISRARQMEYAIRATRLGSEAELARLAEIDTEIHQRWVERGFTADEVRRESLMDLTWDLVQIGQFASRRHSRTYKDREFRDQILKGLEAIPGRFADAVQTIRIPAAQIFRICDLLNGNDIKTLLGKVATALSEARRYLPDDEIELSKFVLGIRDPIPIHPAFRYVDCHEQRDGKAIEFFGFALDTQTHISVPEVMRQMREFLYQYALRKQARGFKDQETDALIQKCLEEELTGALGEVPDLDVNGFMSTLAGLYCWDRVQSYKKNGSSSFLTSAIKDTIDIYPKPARTDDVITDAAIKKSYYKTDDAIEATFRRLYPAV